MLVTLLSNVLIRYPVILEPLVVTVAVVLCQALSVVQWVPYTPFKVLVHTMTYTIWLTVATVEVKPITLPQIRQARQNSEVLVYEKLRLSK